MKILIADDHQIICVALTEMLGSAYPAGSFESVADGDALLEWLEARTCDLLILDLKMPGAIRSIALLEALVASWPRIRILVYTGCMHPSLALAAMDLGVAGYVLKRSGLRIAMEAVATVAAGGVYVDPAVDLDSARAHPWHQLTSSERRVLLAVARGLSLNNIAIEHSRSYKTVAAHKYNGLQKLGLSTSTEVSLYLATHGLSYLLGVDDS